MAEKGLTIVYTGKGKGKTTAALWIALRATGYKKKICMIQLSKVHGIMVKWIHQKD